MKRSTWTAACVLLTASAGTMHSAPPVETNRAPAPKQTPIGAVKVTAKGGFDYAANRLRLFGTVHAQAEDYDLQAEVLTFTFSQNRGALAGATADGTASKQVSGLFQQAAADGTKRVIQVHGDHAVYRPEADRPGGGRMDFTGHVTVTVSDPKALDGPAVAVTEPLTVFLGRNEPGKPAEYPRVQGGPVQIELTPRP